MSTFLERRIKEMLIAVTRLCNAKAEQIEREVYLEKFRTKKPLIK